jgi:hypothetical protein
MINDLGSHSLKAFEATAATAAAYLDACDSGGSHVRVNPDYYQQCAGLLLKIFGLFDAEKLFPTLLASSAAARELADSVLMTNQLAMSRLVYYPQLAVVLGRAAA